MGDARFERDGGGFKEVRGRRRRAGRCPPPPLRLNLPPQALQQSAQLRGRQPDQNVSFFGAQTLERSPRIDRDRGSSFRNWSLSYVKGLHVVAKAFFLGPKALLLREKSNRRTQKLFSFHQKTFTSDLKLFCSRKKAIGCSKSLFGLPKGLFLRAKALLLRPKDFLDRGKRYLRRGGP